jgi:hypothetical protein
MVNCPTVSEKMNNEAGRAALRFGCTNLHNGDLSIGLSEIKAKRSQITAEL